ncbi:MAG: hypothetical protein ACREDU_11185, partial [Methylocella sp.]
EKIASPSKVKNNSALSTQKAHRSVRTHCPENSADGILTRKAFTLDKAKKKYIQTPTRFAYIKRGPPCSTIASIC